MVGIAAARWGIAVALCLPIATQAQEPARGEVPEQPAREFRWQLGGSVNNPGLQQTVELVWSRPLGHSRHPLLAGAHVAGAVVSATTPAQTRLGGWVEYAPVSVFSLKAGAEPVGYFGTFRSVLSFASYDEDFSRAARNRRDDQRRSFGTRVYAAPTVQGRVGRIAARATAEVEHWRNNAPGPYFYEPTRDTLLRCRGDWLVNTSAAAVYERTDGRGRISSAGVFHALTRVSDAPGNRSQRLGAIVSREFAGRHLHMPRPRLTLMAWQYLDDPSKQGQWGAAAAIGFRTGR